MSAIDPRLAEWLASGDTGTSSKSIMLWLSAKVVDKSWGASTPSDVGDLGRCLRLLERIPEWRERMPEMAEAGGLWPTFSKRWLEIESTFFAETGGIVPSARSTWPNCDKTYALLKQIHADAYASDKSDFEEINLGGMKMSFKKDDAFGAAVGANMRGAK